MKTSLLRYLCSLFLLLTLSVAGRASGADWATSYGGAEPGNANTQATATDALGNVYQTGYFTGQTYTLGSVTLTKIGSQDAFVAKMDASGVVLWARNFGGSGASVYGPSIAVDGSGNVYLGGYFSAANLTTPALTKIGNQDAFALKLDSTGATTWAKNFGGSGASAYGYGIAIDGSGNVYLGGDFGNANLTTPALTKIGTTDAFALKLDSTGATTWAKNFGGSGASASGNGIAVDGSGNVYLGGYFTANLTTPALTKIGAFDAFAFKLDSTGATAWAKQFGGSGAQAYVQNIAVDGSGNVYLGGAFSNANLTTPALTRIGIEDAFALKLNSTGTTTWAKNFGGSGSTAQGIGIAVDGSGNVYLGGSFQFANLTTPVLTRIGVNDAFALKLNSSGVTTWAKNFGGSGANAYGNGIAVDGSGNVYLGGSFQIANLTTPALTKIGMTDALALKLDSSGTTIWARGFNSTSGAFTSVSATTMDASGNVYIAGYFNANAYTLGGVTLTRIGTLDAFVAKMDASGVVLWAKNFGGSGASTYGQGITVDGIGNVYLGGSFNANLTTPALTRIGQNDAFALKLDSSGATIWAKNFGGSGAYASGASITVDGIGNVYLGGSFNANLTTPALTRIGQNDAFALKLDSTGATTWAKNFGGSGAYASGASITVDGSGNVYLGGEFRFANLTTPVLTKIGDFDAFVFKLDSSGATTWAKNFGGSGATARGRSIAVDGSGNVYLGGFFASASLTTPALTIIGYTDPFAFKLDSSGATTWAKNFGGSGVQAYGWSIAVDGSGNVYLGGRFDWGGDLTTPALTKIGASDAFAFKLDSAGATTWAKNFGGSGASAFGQSIAVDGSGNVYLGGDFGGANLTIPALSWIGSRDAFIISTQLHTLTFAADPNGSISGATTQTVSAGVNTSAVTAVPAANYHFVNWTGTNGFVTTTSNPLTVTNATSSMTITANFAIDPLPPTATTAAASSITTTTVTLNGTVNDNGSSTTVGFQYGLTTGYGTTANAGTVTSGSGSTPVSAALIGLTCGTTYHFRVVGQNSAGTTNGSDATFTTIACPLAPPVLNYLAKAGNTFTVFRVDPTGTATPIFSGTQTSYTDSALLKPNTIYSYYVTSDLDPSQTTLVTIRTPLYNGWNIVGVPYDTTGIAVSTLFSSPVSAVYEWIPTGSSNPDNNGHYIAVANLSPGKGYFVRAGGSTMLAYSGAANPASVNVTLKPGYTLITNTLTSNMSSIDTNWQIDGFPLGDAIISSAAFPIPVIGGAVYWWNGINYDSWNILDVIPPNRPAIEPWKAYWILNLDTVDHTLTIQ